MKSIGSITTAVAAVLSLMALGAQGETTVDNPQMVALSNYSSWNWMPGKPETSHSAQRMLETAVEKELGKRGFVKTDARADFYVVAAAVFETEIKRWTTDFGALDRAMKKTYRDPSGWGAWTPDQNEAELHVGSFIIHIFDADSQEMVWSADHTLGLSPNPKKSKKIDSAVALMLRGLSAVAGAQ